MPAAQSAGGGLAFPRRPVYYALVGTDTSTPERIVEAATRHLFRKGFHPTGLKDVLAEAGVPKGSFYHWFSSKEELGLAVLRRYVADYDAYLDGILGDAAVPPVERLRRFFADGVGRFRRVGAVDGCLVGNLAQELADQDETFRSALAAALAGWRDRIAAVLAQARDEGDVDPLLDPPEMADFLLNAWEGALLRMKVEASVAPLEAFERVVFDRVLAPPG